MADEPSFEPSFRDLMDKVRTGDSAAVQKMIALYGDAILRAARMRMFNARLRRAFDSEDIFQSVIKSFCHRYARPENNWQINTPGDLANLLASMAKNKVVDKARGEGAEIRGGDRPIKPIDEGEDFEDGKANRPDEIVELKEEYERCWKLFDQDERALYLMHFEKKLSWDRIGALLGATGDACRKKLERILKDVRKRANQQQTGSNKSVAKPRERSDG